MYLRAALLCLALATSCRCGPVPEVGEGPCNTALQTPPDEGWAHLPVGSEISYAANPPASGNHYPVWARYRIHDGVVPRPYWIHNVEHGAVVLLYRPDADPAQIAAVKAFHDASAGDPQCGAHRRMVVTADPELPTPVAMVAMGVVLTGSCVDDERWTEFVAQHRGQGREAVCVDGSYP
jgi:hypothetical protein